MRAYSTVIRVWIMGQVAKKFSKTHITALTVCIASAEHSWKASFENDKLVTTFKQPYKFPMRNHTAVGVGIWAPGTSTGVARAEHTWLCSGRGLSPPRNTGNGRRHFPEHNGTTVIRRHWPLRRNTRRNQAKILRRLAGNRKQMPSIC